MAAAVGLGGCSSGATPESTPTQSWGPNSYADYQSAYADWAPKYVTCARKYGADAVLHPNGSISNAVAEGRPEKELLDASCVDEVGSPPKPPPLTPELLRGQYALLVREAECLRRQGYTISEPPSRDEWVENYSFESWDPLVEVQKAGLDVEAADVKCPQPDSAEAWRIGYGSS